ncbi:hypothetical protein PR048_017707 [Dryococelus australis]|uniref:Uncharacterized protein n=1 Tax=Dryococelus australis TaxID=614101 RepID=A0ABQ9HA83_9NEOP|nr:hypothetical protein PR048_017707 [Dryococelus australis]
MPETSVTELHEISIADKGRSDDELWQALLTHDNFVMRDTVVHENGKVVTEDDSNSQIFHVPLDYYEVKANRPLRLKKKLYEFYTAPITKFWGHSVSSFQSCLQPENIVTMKI